MIIPVAPRDVDESVWREGRLSLGSDCAVGYAGGGTEGGLSPSRLVVDDVLHGVFDLLADLLDALDMPPTTAAQQPKHYRLRKTAECLPWALYLAPLRVWLAYAC